MLNRLDRYRDVGLLILRLGMGVMFVFHGLPKLMAGPQEWARLGAAMANFGMTFAPTFWGFMAVCAEFFGGVALMLGVAFRPTCMLLTFLMVVAATKHLSQGDGLGGASHAIEDGIVFLSLILIGPGRFSGDLKFRFPRRRG